MSSVYDQHFSLSEAGFSIAPDPHYFFLSAQHQEALAHLLYGTRGNGGFVLLTGEVGTGKTTVCRAFLEQLPEDVEVALILNPALDAEELLRAICTEFRVTLPLGECSLKTLVDALNHYLLGLHARARQALLIIDEAQNLQPQVLEQIRLLTNLETSQHKLLRIFLLGQPELREMLAAENLRQLDQRITARVHLQPFTRGETSDYIRHRLKVAGVERALFTPRALRCIHAHAHGIPRLINVLCDRALLGASLAGASQVSHSIVERAAREVRGEGFEQARAPRRSLPLIVLICFVLAFLLGWGGYRFWPTLSTLSWPTLAMPSSAKPVDASTLAWPERDAWALLLRHWGLSVAFKPQDDPCTRIEDFGLACERDRGTFEELQSFDRPALLRLKHSSDTDDTEVADPGQFLVLGAIKGDTAVLELPDGRRAIPRQMLNTAWSGDYCLLWQLPPVETRIIRPNSSTEAVLWLRKLLAQVPDLGVSDNASPLFDADMREALRGFQRSHGLEPDGIAGPRTLIHLYNAALRPGAPHLRARQPAAPETAEVAESAS